MNRLFWLLVLLALVGVVDLVALREPPDEDYVEPLSAEPEQHKLQPVSVRGHRGFVVPEGTSGGRRQWGASQELLERFEQRLSELDIPSLDGYLRHYEGGSHVMFVQLICQELQEWEVARWNEEMWWGGSDRGPCMVHAHYDIKSDEILHVSQAGPGGRTLYDSQFHRPGGGASLQPPFWDGSPDSHP
ncbi:MAG: hypothetical protein H6718_33190 [Polyangiaceae bacterium]|nr:hypothetical protein [Myxococcales bacterium]MCB9590313.1 hypothetical protein [Polyangiaceae bacterium]MCB9605032.1 hypothetical protein [Polyangiaceae bacterium]